MGQLHETISEEKNQTLIEEANRNREEEIHMMMKGSNSTREEVLEKMEADRKI
jgi:hypothetical protein